jgi:hypothetical protein
MRAAVDEVIEKEDDYNNERNTKNNLKLFWRQAGMVENESMPM